MHNLIKVHFYKRFCGFEIVFDLKIGDRNLCKWISTCIIETENLIPVAENLLVVGSGPIPRK